MDRPSYRRTPGCPSRWVDGRVLLVDPDGTSQELEGGAALLWQVLDEPGTVEDVVGRLADLLPPDGLPGPDDVQGAVDLLVDAGLLTNG